MEFARILPTMLILPWENTPGKITTIINLDIIINLDNKLGLSLLACPPTKTKTKTRNNDNTELQLTRSQVG